MIKKSKKNKSNCIYCNGTGKQQIIKNVLHIGKYHIGKEVDELCYFCQINFIDICNEGETFH